jgi:hypothetical protein
LIITDQQKSEINKLCFRFVWQSYLRKKSDQNFYALGHWLDRLLDLEVVHAFAEKNVDFGHCRSLNCKTGRQRPSGR